MLKLLPENLKYRDFEIKAIGLREFAGMKDEFQTLDPFELASFANLFLASFEQLAASLPKESLDHLLGAGKDLWSGGACSVPLPDGRKLIVLNPTHSVRRQKATLMEEISHVFLGHTPSRLAFADADGKSKARDFQAEIEEEAYGVGAAALLPFAALVKFVEEGKTSTEIANHFEVSRALVEFRLRVTKLWNQYGENVLRG